MFAHSYDRSLVSGHEAHSRRIVPINPLAIARRVALIAGAIFFRRKAARSCLAKFGG